MFKTIIPFYLICSLLIFSCKKKSEEQPKPLPADNYIPQPITSPQVFYDEYDRGRYAILGSGNTVLIESRLSTSLRNTYIFYHFALPVTANKTEPAPGTILANGEEARKLFANSSTYSVSDKKNSTANLKIKGMVRWQVTGGTHFSPLDVTIDSTVFAPVATFTTDSLIDGIFVMDTVYRTKSKAISLVIDASTNDVDSIKVVLEQPFDSFTDKNVFVVLPANERTFTFTPTHLSQISRFGMGAIHVLVYKSKTVQTANTTYYIKSTRSFKRPMVYSNL